MKSGSEYDAGFVIRTPTVPYGVSFRTFGVSFTSKTTLITVCSDTAKSESKSEPGFVISTHTTCYTDFQAILSIFIYQEGVEDADHDHPRVGIRFPQSGKVWATMLFRFRYRTILYA